MKKVNIISIGLFFSVLFCVQSHFCIADYTYTFINRTGALASVMVKERGTFSVGFKCLGESHFVVIKNKGQKLVTTKCCINKVRQSKFGTNTWQTVWKSKIPKCKGTGVITKRGDRYILRWKK